MLLLVAACAGANWWFNRPRTAVVRAVTVPQLSTGAGRTLLNASGYVTARREATVSSKVTGKVVEVHIEEGMKVDAGEVLARLDDLQARKTLVSAQLQVAQAEDSLSRELDAEAVEREGP